MYYNKCLNKLAYTNAKMAQYYDMKGMKATFRTLGCKLNYAETSAIEDKLHAVGVETSDGGNADICLVNTCSVTEMADHKCRQVIHKLVKDNPDAFVAVMGCYVQLQPQKVAEIKGVDLVVGMENKGRILEYIAEGIAQKRRHAEALHVQKSGAMRDIKTFVPSCSRGDRTRYFLKVQDGCDYFCTYCTIPYARGLSRSPSANSIVSQAKEVAAQGGKEIVITGVNIGDFGRKSGENFEMLVKALDNVEGIERYRISSIEPNLLTTEIIDFCAKSRKFMPHFHIPLQSGSDEVLRLMHRRYDTAFFAKRIDYIKNVMPDAFIGVDIIVGTRGETDRLFEEAYDFAQSLDVAQYHVFSYSERAGTAALRIPYKVTEAVKHQRSQRLLALSEEKRQEFYRRFVGTCRPVLVEHASRPGGSVHGFTDNYIRVELPEPCSNDDNTLVNVRLGDFNADNTSLTGTII